MILKAIQKILKINIINILMMSLIIVLMATGSCATVNRVTLQGHTISTLTGQKLMWDHQILDRQIGYFSTFGRLARLTPDPMECATLRIGDLDLALWPHLSASTRLQLQKTLGLGYYLKLELMLKRCLQTKWYPYPPIILSSSNQSRTVWNAPKRNSRIKYPQDDSHETRYDPPDPFKRKRRMEWIPLSTGRTQGTTPMMGRSYNSSSMMNRVNGRGPIISSTTGGSPKRASVSDPK